jgi:hypothetical protein
MTGDRCDLRQGLTSIDQVGQIGVTASIGWSMFDPSRTQNAPPIHGAEFVVVDRSPFWGAEQ